VRYPDNVVVGGGVHEEIAAERIEADPFCRPDVGDITDQRARRLVNLEDLSSERGSIQPP
jgi:hypothetical protein